MKERINIWWQTRPGAAAVVLLAVTIGGCLEAEKRIGVKYDKPTDQFSFLVMFTHISADKLAADGGDPDDDSDHLTVLFTNRDHLILLPSSMDPLGVTNSPLAPFADDAFGWLRVSPSSYAQVGLGNASSTAALNTSLPLDQIQIKPGELFNEGGSNLSLPSGDRSGCGGGQGAGDHGPAGSERPGGDA